MTIDTLFDLTNGGRLELERIYDGCLYQRDFDRKKELVRGFDITYTDDDLIKHVKFEGNMSHIEWPRAEKFVWRRSQRSYNHASMLSRGLWDVAHKSDTSREKFKLIEPAFQSVLEFYINNFDRQWMRK